MADNVEVTAGTGTVVHADEYTHATFGAGKTQIVKLVYGAPGTGVDAIAGSGAITTGTLRVCLATDSPGVTSPGQTTRSASVPVTMASDQEATGVLARAHGTNPTAVAAGAAVILASDRHGIPFFKGGHPNTITRAFEIADGDGAQTDLALVTVSAGAKVCVTDICVRADKSNSGNVEVRIGFGTANVPAASASGANGILLHQDLGAGDGYQRGNGAGIIGTGADNEDLRMTCEDPAGGSLYVVFGYHTVES